MLATPFIFAAVTNVPYLAIGASETAGLGVPFKMSYAGIVAQACGWDLVLSAHFGVPSLLNVPPPLPRETFVTAFVDYNNASLGSSADERISRFLKSLAFSEHVLIITISEYERLPALKNDLPKAFLLDRLSRNVAKRAQELHYGTLVLSPLPSPIQDYLLADGLHPNVRGQRWIAHRVLQALKQPPSICSAR